MKSFAILNGPNLDRLGKREPEIYGHETLADLEALLAKHAAILQVRLEFFQSNHEGDLVDRIATWTDAGVAGLIVNPGGLTHTSVVLRDALAGSGLPVVEVHLSNIYRREAFRQHSMTAGAALAVVTGMGCHSYVAALHFLASRGTESSPAGSGKLT